MMYWFRPIRLPFLLIISSLAGWAQPADTISRIAFGSCSRQDEPEQLWLEIMAQKPNLWIWMGDNIYGDSPDMSVLKSKYDRQKSTPTYQQLLKTCPVIGTWDDHDYGINDGGKHFAQKKESKKLALDFLDVSKKSKVRKHDGIYNSYVFGPGKQKVKIILLDTRSFRDTVIRSTEKGRRYDVNPDGDILGEDQWRWLEKELQQSGAAVHIIGSSIQFVSTEHGSEKWGNFPKARQRMIDLLVQLKPANTFFISGDRHIGEVSKMHAENLHYPIYDFTSSGLTHTWADAREEPNAFRVGQLIIQKNFGLIRINWNANLPNVEFELRGKDGVLWQSIPVRF